MKSMFLKYAYQWTSSHAPTSLQQFLVWAGTFSDMQPEFPHTVQLNGMSSTKDQKRQPILSVIVAIWEALPIQIRYFHKR